MIWQNKRYSCIGTVRLARARCVSLRWVFRYRGRKTVTSWPKADKTFGRAPTTSARPPVFEYGTPSDAAKVIRIQSSLGLDSLLIRPHENSRTGRRTRNSCSQQKRIERPRQNVESNVRSKTGQRCTPQRILTAQGET